jgi:spermidine synthase
VAGGSNGPYSLRVLNFLAVSDSPLTIDKGRWMSILRRYRIDGKLVFDPARPESEAVLKTLGEWADSANQPPTPPGMKLNDSLRTRLPRGLVITDDNMGWEWRTPPRWSLTQASEAE